MIARSLYVLLFALFLTAHAAPASDPSATCDPSKISTKTVTVPASGATAAQNNAVTGGANGFGGFGQGGNNNGQGGNNNGQGGNNNGQGGNNNAAAGGNTGTNGDPQKSLTLDPKVIASGFAKDGQQTPAAGQAASITSTNNFINYCLTVPNLPITNGKQIQTGSCNPAPIGAIPSVDNMPSAKFVSPANGATISAGKSFTISMAIKNMQTGNFVNAQENYFAAPQQLSAQGQIIGHSHIVIEKLNSLGDTQPLNPKQFAFFQGLNAAAKNGVLTADVTDGKPKFRALMILKLTDFCLGLPAGPYRMCSINSSSNHQPVIVPVAQHGSLDDCVYFTATNGGGNNGQQNNGQANNGQQNNGQANNGQQNAQNGNGRFSGGGFGKKFGRN
ncbi:hypothetical protein D9758_006240 [Tetrapyrgos nigripes]|uniref:Uncharacterized protein n=1 Tax=Tetrapyrgos nigripes TaxID=182062 RepID=A0A8H5GB37_9AGAR|nr:hypothetical protein D9758_006240 [Tetrapyrgos nigripes]